MKINHNPDKAQSLVLRAIAKVLELDLAIAPMIVASDQAAKNSNMLKGVAAGIRYNYYQIDPSFTIKDVWPFINQNPEKGYEGVLIDIVHGNQEIVEVLRKIEITANFNMILCFNYPLEGENEALDEIQAALGIHRAHVPTARYSQNAIIQQPILMVGDVCHEDSKRRKRYFLLEGELGNIVFRIEQLDDQEDEDFEEVVCPLQTDRYVKVAIRLEVDREDCFYADQNAFEII